MHAIIQKLCIRADGSRDSFASERVECKTVPAPRVYSATGYGSRLPVPYMVRFNGRWRRVYCRIYSNNGTLYIGKNIRDGFVVNIFED